MMNQAIELNIGGIKCDTMGCSYRDDSVKVEDYPSWLNKPCPKCTSNLLTQQDYDDVQQLLHNVRLMNALFSAPKPDEEIVTGEIQMSGNGIEGMTIHPITEKGEK